MLESAGKCAEFFKSSSCKDVEPGDAAVAQCISDLVAAAEAGDSEDAGEAMGSQGHGHRAAHMLYYSHSR